MAVHPPGAPPVFWQKVLFLAPPGGVAGSPWRGSPDPSRGPGPGTAGAVPDPSGAWWPQTRSGGARPPDPPPRPPAWEPPWPLPGQGLAPRAPWSCLSLQTPAWDPPGPTPQPPGPRQDPPGPAARCQIRGGWNLAFFPLFPDPAGTPRGPPRTPPAQIPARRSEKVPKSAKKGSKSAKKPTFPRVTLYDQRSIYLKYQRKVS